MCGGRRQHREETDEGAVTSRLIEKLHEILKFRLSAAHSLMGLCFVKCALHFLIGQKWIGTEVDGSLAFLYLANIS